MGQHTNKIRIRSVRNTIREVRSRPCFIHFVTKRKRVASKAFHWLICERVAYPSATFNPEPCFQECTSRAAKVSTPEREKHAFSEHRADTAPSVILSSSAEGEKLSGFTPDLSIQQHQRGEEIAEESDRICLTDQECSSKRGTSRKQHWKSQSMGEAVQQQAVANSLQPGAVFSQEEEAQEQPTFSANRELWQRRATSQTQLNPPVPPNNKIYRTSQEFREMRQKHTPDLVMDLPLSAQDASKKSASSSSLSSSDEETPVQPSRAEAATSPTGGPESPDMSTAAERFAKQNQCTLKKNTKTNPSESQSKLKRTVDTDNEPEQESEEMVRSASSNQISSESSMPLRSPLPPRSTPKIVAKFADMHLTGGSQVSTFKPQVKVKPTILRKPVLPFPHPHMSPELARKIEKQAQSAEQQTN